MGVSGSHLSRGALAAQTGVNSETIRYYEHIALMPNPERSDGGHRLYNEEHVRRLRFIRRARELGFTLNAIKDLLALVDERRLTCAEVLTRTTDHLVDVRRRIADLRRMERTLKRLVEQCDGGSRPDCPIIAALLLA